VCFDKMGLTVRLRRGYGSKFVVDLENGAATTLDPEVRFDMLALQIYLLPGISMFAVIGLPFCNYWYINTLEICHGPPSTRNSPKHETAPKLAHSYRIISCLHIHSFLLFVQLVNFFLQRLNVGMNPLH
jgi:hypothetical protein